MIKKIFIVLIACIGFANWSYSQTVTDKKFLQNEIPKEQVYLHVNSSLLFSGEKLFYKFYSLNTETKKFSDLSKIGWVILVNSDKEEVFQHKVKLEKGQGYSDFFIPSNLPSGAYKILGYTAWMQNAEENYFKQDIHILNPYQKDNKGLIIKEKAEATTQNIELETAADFSLNLNKNSFSNREEVVLTMDSRIQMSGDFSISVRLIDSFNHPPKIKSTNYTGLYENIRWDFSDTLILPEVRGSLITGKVIGKDNTTLNNKNLMISFPGEENQVNIVPIDENSEFNFTINNGTAIDELLIQLVDHTQDNYTVNLKQVIQPDYSSLDFEKPVVDAGFKEYILEKSINNQIENAYSATKADRPVFPKDEGYFFDHQLLKFNLDDYTRFPEVSQTFTEVIEYGRVRRNSDGTHSILVRNQNANGEFTLPALLIVDGVMVQDHDKLVSFEAEGIQSIGLLRSRLFLGPEIYQGVVVVETKEGDFPEVFREGYIKSAEFITAQNPKKYYRPNYKNKELQRIPDYRYQLLWDPEVKPGTKENKLRFYTSDLDGRFEINLEGFTNEGKPLSVSKIFEVE